MKKAALASILFAGALLAVAGIVGAQQPKKIPRIGFLSNRATPTTTTPDPNAQAFQDGLRDLGYVHGKNILLEFRYAEGKQDRASQLIVELIQRNIDVIVTPVVPAISAAKKATTTIPIVIVSNIDPVESGLINSLAHPGGNITGVTRLTHELSGKRLELFQETLPRLTRIGILRNLDSEISAVGVKEYETAARNRKLSVQLLDIRESSPDFETAFHDAVKGQLQAIITVANPVFLTHRKQIADLANKNRLPSLYETNEYVAAGGLMSYGTNDPESFRRAAYYVDKILKGAKPAELPVEQPTKFELVINLKTAKQIGLTIPQSVLYRADKVIK